MSRLFAFILGIALVAGVVGYLNYKQPQDGAYSVPDVNALESLIDHSKTKAEQRRNPAWTQQDVNATVLKLWRE